MEFEVEKGYGESLCNTIRQVALTKMRVARPIAFKVGVISNVLSAGDNVLEDMVEFFSNVSKYNYRIKSDKEIVSVTVRCDGTMRLGDLNSAEVEVLSADTASVEILHTLHNAVDVVIYFRNGTNGATKDDNTYFLERFGVQDGSLTVCNSRHNLIDTFTIKISDLDEARDKVAINIVTNDGTSEKDVVATACKELARVLSSLS